MRHKDEYDIVNAFVRIEEELIASMIRNMDRHRAEEDKEGILWSQWQVEQLKALEKYKKQNQKKYKKQFRDLNKRIEELIRVAHDTGNMEQEIEILEAIRNGFSGYEKISSSLQAEFFKLNERKLEALIQATTGDMEKAEIAILRRANDQYRKVIYDAQVYANTGAGTYEKAVDMATKDMVAAGLSSVQYSNGAMHKLSEYADMAIRTASKRAYLQGEGIKRQEWSITTVIVNKRGNPCPKCLPFCGKVLIDDVWSGGKKEDGPYPLMSYAISLGLYHPRCKDAHTTYFPGISTVDDTWTEKELENIGLQTKREAQQQFAKRQTEKYERLAKYSLDTENRKQYDRKAEQWRNVRFRTGNLDPREYAADKGIFAGRRYEDITEKLLENSAHSEYDVEELTEVIVDGITYSVDGINVMQNNTDREIEVGRVLGNVFKTTAKLVPEVKGKYKNVSTPDYYINEEKWDLKELRGESKDAIRNAISKKKKQADHFVVDITEYKLDLSEVNRQAEFVFSANNTKFVKALIIIRGKEVLKIMKRI